MAIEKEDRISAIIYPEQVLDFVDLAAEKGLVNYFTLKGPLDEVNILHTAVMLRSIPGKDQTELITLSMSEKEDRQLVVDEIDSQIMAMEVPYSLRNGNSLPSNPALLKKVSESLGEKGMPFILLGIGDSAETQQSMVTLFAAIGLSAETALKSVQMQTAFKNANRAS